MFWYFFYLNMGRTYKMFSYVVKVNKNIENLLDIGCLCYEVFVYVCVFMCPSF